MYAAASRWLCLGAMLGHALAVCAASAQEIVARRPALHWARAIGAEDCIEPGELARGVEQTVGPVFQSPSSADVTLEATVAKSGAGFSLTARMLGAHGEELGRRSLEARGTSCRAFDALWMFVLALMLDPHAALAALPPELEAQLEGGSGAALLAELRSEAEVERVRDTNALEDAEDASAPSDPPRAQDSPPEQGAPPEDAATGLATTATRVQVGAGPLYGVAPAITAALALGFELERDWWMLRVRASGWLPRSIRIAPEPAHKARFAGGQVHLFFCPAVGALWVLRADACLGGFLGFLHGSAQGLSEARAALRPTYGPALEGRLAWRATTNLAVALVIGGHWNVRRDHFYVSSTSGDSLGYRLPAVSAGAWLALVWTLRSHARGAPSGT